MSTRLEMCSVSTFAYNLSQEANLVYWLSNSPVDLGGAAYHEKAVHEELRKLAEALGYRVEKIETKEPTRNPFEEVAGEIRLKADRAYCSSLAKFSQTPCLGWEEKVRSGSFGADEMEAHAEANKLMGRHQGLADALKLIKSALPSITSEEPITDAPASPERSHGLTPVAVEAE